MSKYQGEMATWCRLVRNDGSEWIVTDFQLRDGGIWLSACRNKFAGRTGEDLPKVLDGVPLQNGDRVEWLREDGSVIWAMKNPTDSRVDWGESATEEKDEFFTGDFQASA